MVPKSQHNCPRGAFSSTSSSSAFPILLSIFFLRTASVPFLNLFLYIERNDFQENCEIFLPFSFLYVWDLRSLKEKKLWLGLASVYLEFQCSGGKTLTFQNCNKIFEEWHVDWNTYKQPVFNMKRVSLWPLPSVGGRLNSKCIQKKVHLFILPGKLSRWRHC